MKQKITDVAIEFMNKEESTHLGYSQFGLLQDIWEECFERGIVKDFGSRGGRMRNHPANKMLVVLNALDRDEKRFVKGHMLCCGGRANAEARVRCFRLKDSYILKTTEGSK